MSCTIFCPKCNETLRVRLVVEEEDLPTSVPQLTRTGSDSQYNLPYSTSLGRSSSSDYEGFSDLDDSPTSPVLEHSDSSHYAKMGLGGRKKTRKRFYSHKKKFTKKKK
ncbi:hypothetical protein N9O88_00290 [bacterium]|nr:hypothetical protein [bacterium]